VRWTRPEQWHITLRFLGETTEAQLPTLRDAVVTVAGGASPIDIKLEGWGTFPEHGRPRVVWAGAVRLSQARFSPRPERAPLWDLSAALDLRLSESGFDLPGQTYQPHVTLARVRPSSRVEPLLNILKDEPPRPGPWFTLTPFGWFRATHVTLFQSVLSPEGSTYTPLLEAPLGK
jgi:2'-5' RNA ligase